MIWTKNIKIFVALILIFALLTPVLGRLNAMTNCSMESGFLNSVRHAESRESGLLKSEVMCCFQICCYYVSFQDSMKQIFSWLSFTYFVFNTFPRDFVIDLNDPPPR